MFERGDEVVVIDDFSSGSPDNIAHLRGNPRFECVVGSASDADIVGPLVANCDAIADVIADRRTRLTPT